MSISLTFDQIFLISLLCLVLVFFIWGKIRHDIVAFLALMLAVVAGTVPAAEAFSGFGHPATVTVAVVLIISRGLTNSGAVGLMTKYLLPSLPNCSAHVGLLAGVGGGLSAFMNNVGALALMMPAALRSAQKANRKARLILMPLAFGSILGGMITMIGTPPNIIIANFREGHSGEAFQMFDFTPVGFVVAIAGILFISLIGWRLIPKAKGGDGEDGPLFEIDGYIAGLRPLTGSKAVGMTLSEIDTVATENNAVIISLLRRGRRIDRPRRSEKLKARDQLIVEAGSTDLDELMKALELKPVGAKGNKTNLMESSDLTLCEAVVQPKSLMVNRTVGTLNLRRRFGLVLLAVSRQGHSHLGKLSSFRFRVGDVVLLADDAGRASETSVQLGCLPLAEREINITTRGKEFIAIGLFAFALIIAALGVLPIPIALSLAAGGMIVTGIVPLSDIYESVDWPIIVLLAAMIPIGAAVTSSGTSGLAASLILSIAPGLPAVLLLTIVLVVTMTLSDIINNAATAIVMAPISIEIATQLNSNPDAFLMAVAIGASCAFLTPIGHQNNALVMGPGGYRFGDYWKMGLPLEIIVVSTAIPMLTIIWPL